MPVYEYRCRRCERIFEKLATMASRDHAVECPSCGDGRAGRLISTFLPIAAASSQPSTVSGGCCGGGCGCG